MKRLGKFSFLLFCMIAILMAPLSITASAQKLDPGPTTEKSIMAAGGLSDVSDLVDLASPCDTPNCCDDCTGNLPSLPGGCAQCDAACQSSGSSVAAILRQTGDKLLRAALILGAPGKHVSMLSFKPEAASPPPRA